ncbi:MAG: TA system VapC family ribonuclease toxin [Luteolibacter sp.]
MLLDSNVWLALTFSAHPHHALAMSIFAEASAGSPACFCRATQQSFLRLATTSALLKTYGAEGFTNQDAAELITTLHRLPSVHTLDEPAGLQSRWLALAGLPSASPKVWMDAYLAAFAILHEQEFVTLDRDFKNFENNGLKLRLCYPD